MLGRIAIASDNYRKDYFEARQRVQASGVEGAGQPLNSAVGTLRELLKATASPQAKQKKVAVRRRKAK